LAEAERFLSVIRHALNRRPHQNLNAGIADWPIQLLVMFDLLFTVALSDAPGAGTAFEAPEFCLLSAPTPCSFVQSTFDLLEL
jgi:hypothetical protein